LSANIKQIKQNITIIAIGIIILWLILFLQHLSLLPNYCLGIQARTISGLKGILLSPFIHAGVEHLAANTFPLLILGTAVLYFYPKLAWRIWIYIYLASGIWVWVAARDGCHIGASGIIYGLAFFLFFSGIFRKDKLSLTLALIVSFLYGGIIWGLLPYQEGVSWEGHLFGAIAGVITAYLLRKQEVVPRKKYSWEDENPDEADDSPEIWNYRKYFPPPDGLKHPDD